ncbi:MAG: UvrB/UvrC motif-containing protein [Clostridium sp.]|jgi:protein arginine kinase activator|nr:UvrB/UvrC motif-containing protein [Clostridium sp.]
MKCQNCGVREATTHIKQNINGQINEQHLCSQCAMEAEGGFSLPEVFQSLFGAFPQSLPSEREGSRCQKCGMSFAEIAKVGKLGCAECYRTFYERLMPTIQRIHGRVLHTAEQPQKVAAGVAEESLEDKITKRKAALQEAIQSQNFEQAAALRDEIRELEKEGGNG